MASAVAGLSVHGLPGVASKSNDAEKQNFFAQVEWLPLTSRSRTHRQTTVRLVYNIGVGIEVSLSLVEPSSQMLGF